MTQEQVDGLVPLFVEIGEAMLGDMDEDIISMEWENERFKLTIRVIVEEKREVE